MRAIAALAALLIICPCVASAAHGGDSSVLHACLGPHGVIRAVAPNEGCPKGQIAVHLRIGPASSTIFYTVERPQETFGPQTFVNVTVSCDEGDQIVSGGYVHTPDQPELQVSGSAPAGDRAWDFRVQNFSPTLSYQIALYARCAKVSP